MSNENTKTCEALDCLVCDDGCPEEEETVQGPMPGTWAPGLIRLVLWPPSEGMTGSIGTPGKTR